MAQDMRDIELLVKELHKDTREYRDEIAQLRQQLAAARDELVAEDKRYCEALEYIARLDEQWQAAEARAAEADRLLNEVLRVGWHNMDGSMDGAFDDLTPAEIGEMRQAAWRFLEHGKSPLGYVYQTSEKIRKLEARVAAEGDRAAGLETELQHCKAKREQAEERGQLCLDALAMKTEELETRAEAAEAALEQAQKLAQLHSSAHDRCCEERRVLFIELEFLRRVAEARKTDVKLLVEALREYAKDSVEQFAQLEVMMEVWESAYSTEENLAAWDAARVSTDEESEGGDEDDKE